MAKIYNLDGEPVPEEEITPGSPDTDVVAALEALLERAKSGNMRGLACVYLHDDWATGAVIAGTRSFSIVGRMEDVKLDILDDLS